MTPEERERRYVRKPKPESKLKAVIGYFYAYDADGNFKGEVVLTSQTMARYEAMGYSFKRRWRAREEFRG